MAYNQTQAKSITNARYVMFVSGVNVGVISEEGVTFNYEPEYETQGSGLTGTAPVAKFLTGGTATLEATVTSFNKNVISTIFGDVITEGSTPTNINSPYVGALQGIITPKRQATYSVVLYPFVTDESGNVVADTETTAVQPAITMQEAVIAGNLEIVWATGEAVSFTATFEGIVDVANSNRQWIMDDGIDTDGSYTP